eukprot:1981098-Prymnesium_polylepis.3
MRRAHVATTPGRKPRQPALPHASSTRSPCSATGRLAAWTRREPPARRGLKERRRQVRATAWRPRRRWRRGSRTAPRRATWPAWRTHAPHTRWRKRGVAAAEALADAKIDGDGAALDRHDRVPVARWQIEHRACFQVVARALRHGRRGRALQLLGAVARQVKHASAAVGGQAARRGVPLLLAVELDREIVVIVVVPARHVAAHLREVDADLD